MLKSRTRCKYQAEETVANGTAQHRHNKQKSKKKTLFI